MLKQKTDRDSLRFGLFLLNKIMFRRYFWKEDLTSPLSIKQRIMLSDTSRRQMGCTARKVWKTGNIEATIVQTAITKTSNNHEDYLFFTPGRAQIDPTRERIFAKLTNVPLFKMMVETMNKSEGAGIIKFKNDCIWHMRIEGSSGTGENMVGLRAKWIIGDEGAFGDHENYKQRQMVALPDCEWRWYGVPNGIRNSPFYKIDQTSEGADWNHHHLCTFDNPIFNTPEQRAELIKLYSNVNTQGYITQVLGEWGDEAFSTFPLIPRDKKRDFVLVELSDDELNVNTINYDFFLRSLLPLTHSLSYQKIIAGIDVGYSPDPSVISVFYEEKYDQESVWYELARIKMYKVITDYQARLIHALNRLFNYQLACIAIDTANYGRGIVEKLRETDHEIVSQWNYDNVLLDANTQGAWIIGEQDGNPIPLSTKEYTTMLLRDGLGKGFEFLGGYAK